ncbi:cytochrome P450 family protein [Sphaerimonospora mesophila]|uniref:cytochrome P450 family protein n=1 Tax=Sphaerimonospora mesophila TaxID=37483 RepID=UPI0006E1D988
MTEEDVRPRTPFDRAFLADPHPSLARYREECPVAHVVTPAGRPMWMITRDADVRAAFTDPRLALGTATPRRPQRRALNVTLVDHDPPHHTRIRRLAAPLLTPRRLEAYRPAIRAIAAELLDRLGGRGEVELLSAFAYPFSFQVICEVLAVPAADRPELYDWIATVFDRTRGEARATALDRIDAYFQDVVGRGPGEPGDDVLSSIVAAWDPGGEVARDEVVSLCAMLLMAGYESTAQMIGMSVAELLRHREILAALRADPALAPRAVEELLRYHTPGPFGTVRTTTEDVRVGGTVIPAGSRVLLSISAANRDPARHDRPDLLDVDRNTAAGHLTFGMGPHYCLGAPLARLELTVALTGIARRFPRMTPVTPLDRLSWQGNHLNRGLAELLVRPGPYEETPAPGDTEAT